MTISRDRLQVRNEVMLDLIFVINSFKYELMDFMKAPVVIDNVGLGLFRAVDL